MNIFKKEILNCIKFQIQIISNMKWLVRQFYLRRINTKPIKVSNPFTIKISNPKAKPNQASLFRFKIIEVITDNIATIGVNLSFICHFVNNPKLYNPNNGPQVNPANFNTLSIILESLNAYLKKSITKIETKTKQYRKNTWIKYLSSNHLI